MGVLDGIHFDLWFIVDDSERNIPEVPLTSNPRDHFAVAFFCRFQNRSGFSSNGRDGSVARGRGIGVVSEGGG